MMNDILSELNNKDYIKTLNTNYDIHFCKKSEVTELVEFIDKYWRKDHIFVLSRELLDWQHYDGINDRYNFVIAKHRHSQEIHAILGFIPTYQFDSSISRVEVWPCIWKSRADVHVKGLGVALHYYMKTNIQIETISIFGFNETTLGIHKNWNFSTGKMEQYYYPNPDEPEVLSANREKTDPVSSNRLGWYIRELSLEEYRNINPTAIIFKHISPYKSKNFYINRYYLHPMYTYGFLAVYYQNEIQSIIIVRECCNDTSKCLRIVDYIGEIEHLTNIRYDLQEIMKSKKYEYIDFVNIGISPEILKAAGFINRKDKSDTIIPHFFEPFLKANIDLDFAFKTVNPEINVLLFKADVDQDRPSLLEK